MVISLTSNLEESLRREAARRGVNPEECARQILEQGLARDATGPNTAALDLLDQWDREDETDDPAEIAKRQRDFEEFKEAMNSSHSSSRKIYP